MRNAFLLLTLTCSVYADSSVQGPKAGYIASNSGVRPILGIIGSSRLGDPVAKDLQHVTVLPGTDIALGISSTAELTRVNLSDNATAPLDIKEVSDVVASPSGESLVAIAGGVAQVIDKTGSKLASFPLPAAPARIAVADQGSSLAMITEGGSLYLIDANGAREVFHSAALPALAFLPNSSDLVIADESGVLFRINADLKLTKLATVAGTKALAAQASRLLAVTENAVSAVNLQTGEVTSTDCPCAATAAHPLGGSNFLLTNPDDGPIWVLDASVESLRVAFIPEPVDE
jgi:hypothetical protein